jgi:hypothetical protein
MLLLGSLSSYYFLPKFFRGKKHNSIACIILHMFFLPTEKPTKLWCSISESIVSSETTNLVKSSSGLVVNCGSILQNPKPFFLSVSTLSLNSAKNWRTERSWPCTFSVHEDEREVDEKWLRHSFEICW